MVRIKYRRDDGTYVLLVCEEDATGAGGGIVVQPIDEGDIEYPMVRLAEHRLITQAEALGAMPFQLVVDVSELGSGELRFHNHVFVGQCGEHADAGEVAITGDTAAAWGFMGMVA